MKRISSFCLSLLAICFLIACSAPAFAFNGDISVDVSTPGTWIYTIYNNEPSESWSYLWNFEIAFNAPGAQVLSPNPGWIVTTDNATYAIWTADDSGPNELGPGDSLTGFTIISNNSASAQFTTTLDGWDYDTGTDHIAQRVVHAPIIPEPSALLALTSGIILLASGSASRRFRQRSNNQ